MDQDPQHLRPSEASGIDLKVFRDVVVNVRRAGDGNDFQIFCFGFFGACPNYVMSSASGRISRLQSEKHTLRKR